MASQLSTERLRLRPSVASDDVEYRALAAEWGGDMPSAADIHQRIATQLAARAQTGIALLPICRRLEGDFIGYCGPPQAGKSIGCGFWPSGVEVSVGGGPVRW